MPTNPQSLFIYLIVFLTLAWLFRGWWKRRKDNRVGCGEDCECSKDGVKRNPAIQNYLRRHK